MAVISRNVKEFLESGKIRHAVAVSQQELINAESGARRNRRYAAAFCLPPHFLPSVSPCHKAYVHAQVYNGEKHHSFKC